MEVVVVIYIVIEGLWSFKGVEGSGVVVFLGRKIFVRVCKWV